MFNWFRPKCPVEPDTKAWIDRRMNWLAGQFGRLRLLNGEVILPDEEYFPDPYDGSADDAQALLDRVCAYMDIDPTSVTLQLYAEQQHVAASLGVVWSEEGSTGRYTREGEQTIVWLEASHLADPVSVVATFAHELCHAHLLGDGRLSPEETDHEPLTDLATVYFGMGIFTANASLRDKAYHAGNWEHWSISRQGYLNAPALAYALALFAWLREETSPGWTRHLRLDVRSPFKKALAYLANAEDAVVLEPDRSPHAEPPACPAHLLPKSLRQPQNAEETAAPAVQDEEIEDGDRAMTAADDCFTEGMEHVQNEQWEEAVRSFTRALAYDCEDAEAHQQRALAYANLGALKEALADAQDAVRLLPDDPESYRVRGMVRLYSKEFARAIEDFGRYFEELAPADRKSESAAMVYYLRGRAREGTRDYRGALQDCTLAIRYWPQWPAPYRARAGLYQRLGKTKQALADREEAAQLAGKHGEGPRLF